MTSQCKWPITSNYFGWPKIFFYARSVTLIVQNMYRLSITAIIHILFHTLQKKKYRKLDKSK